MTTYIEDWIDNPSIKNLCNSTYSSQSVLKCDSEIENNPDQLHYNWNIYNSFLKWINKNYRHIEWGAYQSWNPGMNSLLGEQVVSTFIEKGEEAIEDFYIKPIPIKSYELKVKIISKSKGTPKIYPID